MDKLNHRSRTAFTKAFSNSLLGSGANSYKYRAISTAIALGMADRQMHAVNRSGTQKLLALKDK
jgi:hypothetical protein